MRVGQRLQELILHAGYGLSLIALIATCAAAQTITLRRAVELTLSHSGVTGMADPDQARAYAAYREAQALLTRREQELAELRRRLESKPIRLGERVPASTVDR